MIYDVNKIPVLITQFNQMKTTDAKPTKIVVCISASKIENSIRAAHKKRNPFWSFSSSFSYPNHPILDEIDYETHDSNI